MKIIVSSTFLKKIATKKQGLYLFLDVCEDGGVPYICRNDRDEDENIIEVDVYFSIETGMNFYDLLNMEYDSNSVTFDDILVTNAPERFADFGIVAGKPFPTAVLSGREWEEIFERWFEEIKFTVAKQIEQINKEYYFN